MNNPDPLAQLRDIHVPDTVSWWPPGPGWWVVFGLLLFATVLLLLQLLRRHRRRAYRRQAVGELNRLYAAWQQSGDDAAYLQSMNAVLKRVAIASFGREQVARLQGEHWLAFLDRQWTRLPEHPFCASCSPTALYAPPPADVNVEHLHTLSRRWVKRHRGRHD